ncbi:unnamed protein product [Linum trigynum]|uniref:Protein FATTY ACID EXPORT 3, chloroplastic n=1 Tax=Linum trigynum TaxID=586398 RepID=A0AAV2FRV3_9ROSI
MHFSGYFGLVRQPEPKLSADCLAASFPLGSRPALVRQLASVSPYPTLPLPSGFSVTQSFLLRFSSNSKLSQLAGESSRTMNTVSVSLKNPKMASCYYSPLPALPSSCPSIPSLHFQPSLYSLTDCRASLRLSIDLLPPNGLRLGLPSLRCITRLTSIVASAASRQESAHPDFEVEKNNEDLDARNQESQEAWKKALESFKEQAIHMKGISQEAYEVYSKKAMVILGETSEQLKIQAERARRDLNSLAKEINEAAENSPEGVRDILETISSSTDVKDFSELKDYHVGIGYGSIVFAGGFAAFMLVGSISAVRFGVILGGALLALGIASRRAQNNGEAYDVPLKGQTAIATIIFLRKITLLFQRGSLFQFVSAVISTAVLAFYCYRIGMLKGTKWGTPAEE